MLGGDPRAVTGSRKTNSAAATLPDDQRAALALRVLDRRTALARVERAQKAGEAGGHGRSKDDSSVIDGDHQAISQDGKRGSEPGPKQRSY